MAVMRKCSSSSSGAAFYSVVRDGSWWWSAQAGMAWRLPCGWTCVLMIKFAHDSLLQRSLLQHRTRTREVVQKCVQTVVCVGGIWTMMNLRLGSWLDVSRSGFLLQYNVVRVGMPELEFDSVSGVLPDALSTSTRHVEAALRAWGCRCAAQCHFHFQPCRMCQYSWRAAPTLSTPTNWAKDDALSLVPYSLLRNYPTMTMSRPSACSSVPSSLPSTMPKDIARGRRRTA
jgi:hypothetical protein